MPLLLYVPCPAPSPSRAWPPPPPISSPVSLSDSPQSRLSLSECLPVCLCSCLYLSIVQPIYQCSVYICLSVGECVSVPPLYVHLPTYLQIYAYFCPSVSLSVRSPPITVHLSVYLSCSAYISTPDSLSVNVPPYSIFVHLTALLSVVSYISPSVGVSGRVPAFICPSVSLFVRALSISVYLSANLSVFRLYMFIYQPIYRYSPISVHLLAYLSVVSLSVRSPPITVQYMYICQPTCLCSNLHLSICQLVCAPPLSI